jgi:hypothetical protein
MSIAGSDQNLGGSVESYFRSIMSLPRAIMYSGAREMTSTGAPTSFMRPGKGFPRPDLPWRTPHGERYSEPVFSLDGIRRRHPDYTEAQGVPGLVPEHSAPGRARGPRPGSLLLRLALTARVVEGAGGP